MSKCKSCDANGCDDCGGRGYVTDCTLAEGEHWGEISGKRYPLILDPKSGRHRFKANPVVRQMVDAASAGKMLTLDACVFETGDLATKDRIVDEFLAAAMKNRVVQDFTDAAAAGKKFDLNTVASRFMAERYTSKELLELYKLIGYSMGGLAELSYFERYQMDTCEWKKPVEKR